MDGGFFERVRHEIGRRRRMSARLLIFSSVITVLGFSAVCGSVMLDMRRNAQELSRQIQENLASTLSADINRNIELYDLSLRSVVTSLALPQLAEVDDTIRPPDPVRSCRHGPAFRRDPGVRPARAI